MRGSSPWLWVLVLATPGLLGLGGCDGGIVAPRHPHATIQPPPPANGSPAGALRLLEWCWNNRNPTQYCRIFAKDFQFSFSALDPYGDDYQVDPWVLDDEMEFARHFFQGGHATQPAATEVALVFDRNFIITPDPRPGKNPMWHKRIRTGLTLTVIDPNAVTQITGFGNFFLVRGDSASVPTACGGTADSMHWYIDRWEDDTAGSPGGLKAMPTKQSTLGSLKALYR